MYCIVVGGGCPVLSSHMAARKKRGLHTTIKKKSIDRINMPAKVSPPTGQLRVS